MSIGRWFLGDIWLILAKILGLRTYFVYLYRLVFTFNWTVGDKVIPNYAQFSPELSTGGSFEHKIYLYLGKFFGKIIHRTIVLVLVSDGLTG